jgi:signal transduction histidine kinase/DNA-binding response OmpR family regulator/ligand-binding sensor domain-containing protein
MNAFLFLKIKLFFIVFICLSLTVNVFAVKFYNINSLYGTSLRNVSSVCKDDKGFIWASSGVGILRVAEGDCRIYQLPYKNNNVISVDLVFESSKLVVYTNNGQIFLYNAVFDRFDLLVDINEALNRRFITVHSILIDPFDTYWIASSNGFYKYQSGQFSLVLEDAGISDDNEAITRYDESNVLIGRNDGIWLFDLKSLKNTCVYSNPTSANLLISTLYFDKEVSQLLVGTISNGLYVFDFDTKVFSRIQASSFPRQPILDIEKNSGNSYLIAIDGQGLWELSTDGSRVLNIYKENVDDPTSLRGNGAYDIFCDSNRRVWVCTVSGGLSFFDQESPMVTQILHETNNANSLKNNDVNNVIEDRWGQLWFATNNGISIWNVQANQWKHLFSDNRMQANVFLSLCEDDNGRIWAGSYSNGVYVIDAKSGAELAHYTHDNKNGGANVSDFVLDIYKDSQGDIWIGGINGEFVCYLTKESRFVTYSVEPISSFDEISPNQILLGCSYGLNMLNKRTGDFNRLLFGFSVNDIFVDGNKVWICTKGDGLVLYYLDTKTTVKLTTQSGLPSNFVNSIVSSDNYLWIGTENGLCRLNPADNDILTYPSIYSFSRTSFNNGAHFKLKNGQLAWGSNNGVLIFSPQSIKENLSQGFIFIQDIIVSGRSIRDEQSIELNSPVDSLTNLRLKYFQNTIGLELLPMQTTSGVKFSWKLDGFDKDWSLPSENKILTYTNLPSGEFILMLRLYDSSMSQIIAERRLAIHIVPPIWKMPWFWILIYLIILGFALLVIKYHIKTIKQKHTDDKVRFFTNMAHHIRTSLTLIKAPIEELSREKNLSETGKNYLNLAIEQSRRLSMVVTQLMDFQKVDIGKEQIAFAMFDMVKLIRNRISMFESLAKSRDIELVFATNAEEYVTGIDESKMEKVVDNLISNAVKYSHPHSQVHISMLVDPNQWVLSVDDNGIGIDKVAQRHLFKEFYRGENAVNSKIVGSGIGLMLVKQYVGMHRGTIRCMSRENGGTSFQVTIPFLKASSNDAEVQILDKVESVERSTIFPASYHVDGEEEQNPVKMNLLVVEDNDDLLHFLKDALSVHFNVVMASNGAKAWDIINQQMPDIVVSDIMMPEMDGFELCQLMKSTYETSHIPIVLLSALSDRTEQLRGLGLGADDYLTKPFDISLLMQRIKSMVRNRDIVREKALKVANHELDEPILSNALNDRFMKRVREVALENIANSEFKKEEFASALNVSSSLLYKKIKSLTNLSPTDFIKTVRLEHALELLQTREYNVTEISEMCGFSSVGYFSTVFRKHFGKSPTEVIESV